MEADHLFNGYGCLFTGSNRFFTKGLICDLSTTIGGILHMKSTFLFILLSALLIVSLAQSQTRVTTDVAHVEGGTRTVDSLLLLSTKNVLARPDTALRLCMKALVLAENLGYKKGIAGSYKDLGTIAIVHSNFKEGFSMLLKAKTLFSEINDSLGIGKVYTSLGIGYHEINDYRESLRNHRLAYQIFLKHGGDREVGIAQTNIGYCLMKLDSGVAARKILRAAATRNARLNVYQGLTVNLENLARLAIKSDSLQKAVYYLDSAYKVIVAYPTQVVPRAKIFVLLSMATVAAKTNDSSKQINYLKQALRYAREARDVIMLKEAYTRLGDYYYLRGDAVSASNLYRTYSAVNDSLHQALLKEQSYLLEYFNEVTSLSAELERAKTKRLLDEVTVKKKSWQLAAAVLFTIIIVTIFIFYRERVKRRQREMNFHVHQLEYTALKAQMNPHFIFNAMNSIQALIAQSKTNEALRYVSKFAKLLRSVLENSGHNLISLDKELENIRLYVHLEALRLNFPLDFTISVAPDVVPESELIPPLIVQPFVENTLWHGFRKKEGSRQLEIKVFSDTDDLICQVIDNGIGRKQASLLKSILGKTSKGVSITEKRLRLLDNNSNRQLIIFDDLVDAQGHACGTKVTLRIRRPSQRIPLATAHVPGQSR